ncbi:GntR family transcriptional regulator [Niallia sp. 01092]|uniref:GntR family transcriptional regulator n=1 Tax=unclassified Niallia TaxID=2837522 RepID=UPI003FD19958
MMQKIVQSETLADRAYNEIKKAIIRGDFKPGDPLPEEEIASMLGISRTPIRKAIAELTFDGLVTSESGKKARISFISDEDFEHYIKLRKVLEVLSAEEAAPLVTDGMISHLEMLMTNQKKAIEEKDLYTYIDLDSQFHLSIAEISRNRKLQDFIEQIHNQLSRYLVLSGTLAESAREAHEEHIKIIEALKERNAKKAGEAIRFHIENVERRS